jgi:ABC-type lipoprotein release transport system permease subunit
VFDPITLSIVVVLIAGTALLACWLPARRAARVNPTEALRYE